MPRKKQTISAAATELMVAKNITHLRLSQGIARQKIAQAIGITHQQLQKYESATNRISVGTLGDIANYFGIPIASLFDENNNVLKSSGHQDTASYLLIKSFSRIKNKKLKKALRTVIKEAITC